MGRALPEMLPRRWNHISLSSSVDSASAIHASEAGLIPQLGPGLRDTGDTHISHSS